MPGNEPLKLNLGCGFYKIPGAINVDIDPSCRPDKIVDLERKLPFRPNSFSEIYAISVIEHVENLFQIMREIHRVGKNGCKVIIKVPYYNSRLAYDDPTHCNRFTEKTFEYFTKDAYKSETSSSINVRGFRVVRQKIIYPPYTNWLPERLKGWLKERIMNFAIEMETELEVIK